MSGLTIHIHEDDWGLRRLYPLTAWPEAAADLRQAETAAVENRAPDGAGWTDMLLIATPSETFLQRGLRTDALRAALTGIMPGIAKFNATATAGFGDERDPYGVYDEAPICYGFDAECFVKVETRGDLVSEIWFEARTSDDLRRAALLQALAAIDQIEPAFIVDYWLRTLGPVADPAFMSRYAAALSRAAES